MPALKPRRRRWRYVLGAFVLLIVLLVGARIYLNVWLLKHVNHVLSTIEGYQGSVEDIDIALYRGAYKIHKLRLDKKNGKIPVPFVAVEQADLSIEWKALLHGRVVSNIDLIKPTINFAVNKADTVKQTGAGVDWTRPIKELMPIDINLVTFKQGKLSYQDFSTEPKVNVYINNMSGEVGNLRNVDDQATPLPSTLLVRGDSIGGGKLELKGKMNILRPVPDMDIDTKLENVHLPELSNYTSAYAAIDIHGGQLDLYSRFTIKNNRVSGYVKPIATKVELIDLSKESNPIKAVWQMAVAVVVEVFSNQSNDQFATKVPLEGNLDNIGTDSWAAVAGIIRNAFIEAFKRGVERK